MGSTGISLKKKRKTPDRLQSTAAMISRIETDLALGVGTTRVKRVDPIHFLKESFRSTFDQSGQNNASQFAAINDLTDSRGEIYGTGRENEEFGKNVKGRITEQQQGESAQKLGREFPYYESTTEEKAKGDFSKRFSKIAFQNGNLASAVLRNGGKTMFVSCLKRALKQSETTNFRQRKLFSISSVNHPVSNTIAKAEINRYTNRAIELVVESILRARQTLQLFERQALSDSEKVVLGMKNNIIRNIYPFLTIAKDAEKLVVYEEKLGELTLLEGNTGDRKERNEIASQKAVLAVGITKIQGQIIRKRQMQNQFFHNLEQLLDNSRKAEAVFTAPCFADSVVEELIDLLEFPEDDSDDPQADKPKEDDPREDKPEESSEKVEKYAQQAEEVFTAPNVASSVALGTLGLPKDKKAKKTKPNKPSGKQKR